MRSKVAFIAALLAVTLVLGVVASYAYSHIHQLVESRYGDYTGPGTGTVEVTVPENATLLSMAPILVKDGVILAAKPFETAAQAATNAASLQPGVYKMHNHMNAALACNLLLSGKTRVADQVTIREGLRASAVAQLLGAKTGHPASEFLQIINHPLASLGLPSYANGRTEGYLFPDTYTILPTETPLAILQAMVTEFKQKMVGLNLAGAAAKGNLSPSHVIIIASLVQAEGNGRDFGQIARVVDNRLNDHMLLEFDSTVFYGLHIYGTSATTAETKIDTPYNTYLHTGLPAGPIDSPGLAAIDAALHPQPGPWIYFITVNLRTGETLFTASHDQFEQWQRQYQG